MPIRINNRLVAVPADPRVSLLDLLREHLHLSGTKKGCNQGACGACTVLVDGERILSYLSLAVQYEGRSIITVEGLSHNGLLTNSSRRLLTMTVSGCSKVFGWRRCCQRETGPDNDRGLWSWRGDSKKLIFLYRLQRRWRQGSSMCSSL